MYKIDYKFNLFPGYPTTKVVTVKNLTPQGVTIMLRNLLRDALNGIEIKNVTITKQK